MQTALTPSSTSEQAGACQAGGYVMDVCFPRFFYQEMQPFWLASVAGMRGLKTADFTGAFSFCDLGCGTGTNLLVAAACHPRAQFTGVDANPRHIAEARSAATALGLTNLRFLDASFQDFAADTAVYDAISCHGVWSWIAPEHQAHLLQCAAEKLKPLGLFALHYMTHPGSTGLIPLQHLLRTSAQHMPGTSLQKVTTAMKLLRLMADRGAFHDKPDTLRHLANWEQRAPADLAHEFLTLHWQPQHSSELHLQVAEAGLSYTASADVFHNLDTALSVPRPLQGLIDKTSAPLMAEMLKDLARNTHQRTDMFQKAPEPLSAAEKQAAMLAMTFRLQRPQIAGPPYEFATPIGTVEAPETLASPLIDALRHGPASIGSLLQKPALGVDLTALLQLLQLLMSQGVVHPVMANRVQPDVAPLNAWLAQQSLGLTVIPSAATAIPHAAPAIPPL